MNSKYEVIQESDTQAKRAIYENLIDGRLFTFPHCQMYLKNPSQIKMFLSYSKKCQYSQNLKGVVLPIDRVDMITTIPKEIRDTLMLSVDTMPEAFYYGSLKEDIYKRFATIPQMPAEVASALSNKNRIQNPNVKDDKYADQMDNLFLDEAVRVRFVNAVVNRSLAIDAPIINAPGAYIRQDGSGWDINKQLYEQTRRLFLGGTTDIDESSGKRIALTLTMHKSVLSNDGLIKNIIDYINEEDHKAINLKILRPTDKPGEQEFDYSETINTLKLLKTIGNYSKAKSVPVHLMCDNTLGFIALMHGIDCFSQPLNFRQLETEGGGDMGKSMQINPTIQYGRIYNPDVRKPIYHKDYIAQIRYNGGNIPCPAGQYCATLAPSQVIGMKRNAFWEHAKFHLMEMRNYEMDELIKAINDKNVRALRSRFKYYFNQFILSD